MTRLTVKTCYNKFSHNGAFPYVKKWPTEWGLLSGQRQNSPAGCSASLPGAHIPFREGSVIAWPPSSIIVPGVWDPGIGATVRRGGKTAGGELVCSRGASRTSVGTSSSYSAMSSKEQPGNQSFTALCFKMAPYGRPLNQPGRSHLQFKKYTEES